MSAFMPKIAGVVYDTPLQPLPTNEEELRRCLADPEWRLFSGCLYKIMIKGDETLNAEGEVVDVKPSFTLPFKPNHAQRRFLKRLHYRNLILKARQLGFTTLIAVLWLDHALFNADQRCGIIAQDLDTAKAIFRDKVKFAYENMPALIRDRFPLVKDAADELLFAHNNSSIRVATSLRGGTIHRLHVSEFGKICAKYPEKATEVVTGSIPAVPINGVLVVESTAEGREGEFYEMVQIAQRNHASRKKLTARDHRFHFYAWWQEPKYRMDSTTVSITAADHEYFDQVEVRVRQDMGIDMVLDPDQRAWYAATRAADFSGKEEKMWQEYPSFPDEAFQLSTAGNYYAKDMTTLRKRGGIRQVLQLDLPVNTFWDIGNSDGCAIWFQQYMNGEDRFINYYEAHNENLRHYVEHLTGLGYVFGTHYLPHDAAHQRLGDYNKSTQELLQELMPGQRFDIVPRVTELINGIYATRKNLKTAYFDEKNCKLGIQRIEGYKKRFSRQDNRFTDQPDKSNGCSEGADALRQWAQAKELGMIESYSATTPDQTNNSYREAPAPDWRL